MNTIWDKKNKLDHIESICCCYWFMDLGLDRYRRTMVTYDYHRKAQDRHIVKFIDVGGCLSRGPAGTFADGRYTIDYDLRTVDSMTSLTRSLNPS